MQRIIRTAVLLTAAMWTAAAAAGTAAAPDAPPGAAPVASAEPFSVGTFDAGRGPFVGLVLHNRLIVELNGANAAFEAASGYPAVPMPEDMLQLIGRYEYGLKYRLYEIVNHLVRGNRLTGGRPAYVHDLKRVDVLAPIQYPSKVMNAAVNFYSHVEEAASEAQRREAMRQRRENRGVPYLFLKPTRGAIVGDGEPIVIPHGRTRTDWEVELATVIGRPARYASAAEAEDYVFGYMVSIDVSDRGGRPPGGFDAGIDWFVGKGHDSFAPQGPWIVPKEFYGNPMQRLHQQLTIDGVTVQEARAGDMIHSLWELIEYASSIITLFPGDVLNSGTSGGTAAGASEQRGQGGFLEPGETIEASIEGIGTLTMPVVAGEAPPGDLSGSNLPPVSSYRD